MPKIYLVGTSQRQYAKQALAMAPDNCVVSITKPKRTIPQNDKMWVMIGDLMRSEPMGRKWTQDQWKAAFMYDLGYQVQFQETLDGQGQFPSGFHSKNLSVEQMSQLIANIYEYGGRFDVEWKEAKRSGFMEADNDRR